MLARAPSRLQTWSVGESSLLPFLFCTRTIQRTYGDDAHDHYIPLADTHSAPQSNQERWPPRRQRLDQKHGIKQARRGESSRRRNNKGATGRKHGSPDYTERSLKHVHRAAREIPFEYTPTTKDTYSDLELQGSTITPNERKAFEGLFQLQKPKEAQEDKNAQEGKKIKGDDALDAILAKVQAEIDADGRRTSQLPAALRDLVQQARGRKIVIDEEKQPAVATRDSVIATAAQKEIRKVSKAMQAAQTDVEVWQILQERVLQRVAAFNLDRSGMPENSELKNVADDKASVDGEKNIVNTSPPSMDQLRDLELLPSTLPEHLTNTISHLRKFPSSHLPLTVLPHLKSLGPTAFAIGASTQLYDMHMRLLFQKHTDLQGVVATLEEMEREVYAFDSRTEELLAIILGTASRIESGAAGPAVRALWMTDRMRQALAKVWQWKKKITGVLQERAIIEARAMEDAALPMTDDGHL